MDITLNFSDSLARITISGAVDTLDSEKLLAELEKLPKDVRSIEFDMERVDYISSAGLRALLRAMDIAGERGGDMKVVKSSGFVREILAAVGFNKLFEVV